MPASPMYIHQEINRDPHILHRSLNDPQLETDIHYFPAEDPNRMT